MGKIEPITGRYVWVPYNGTEYRIFFEEAGQGIPMVCLHTAGTDSREWRHQLCDPAINANFRVIAIDIPRHGKSIPPYDWYKELVLAGVRHHSFPIEYVKYIEKVRSKIDLDQKRAQNNLSVLTKSI